MTNDSTTAPVRKTSRKHAAALRADCRPGVVAQLEQLIPELNRFYVSADDLHQDAWFLMGQAADHAEGIMEEHRLQTIDACGMVARIKDFRAFLRGAEAILIEETHDDERDNDNAKALHFLRQQGEPLSAMISALLAQNAAEPGGQERPRIRPAVEVPADAPAMPTRYTAVQLRMILNTLVSDADRVNRLLMAAMEHPSQDQDAAMMLEAAQSIVRNMGALADVDAAIIGDAGTWHCGPFFEDAGKAVAA